MNEREQFEAWANAKFGAWPNSAIPQTERFVSYWECWHAALAASPVPAGYKLVPVEPTRDMQEKRRMKQVEPFVVKHYSADERPTIKGNGFDGLEIGEDREEAERFIAFVNAAIAASPVPAGRVSAEQLQALMRTLHHADRPGDLWRSTTVGEKAVALKVLNAYLAAPSAPAQQAEASLDQNELYRLQMAAISTAAFGYWKLGDPIKDEYVTVALKDVASLYEKYDALFKAAAAPAPSVEAQASKLESLSREIVKLHKERGCVLTAHVEQMADLLSEIDALKESQQ